MKTKEEILSKCTGMTVSDDMVRMQTEIPYILNAMEEYAQQQVKNNVSLDCVSNQRELFISIFEFICETCDLDSHLTTDEIANIWVNRNK